ncbi:MAG: PAS domain S-box protein [Phycisphaerales bacterium]
MYSLPPPPPTDPTKPAPKPKVDFAGTFVRRRRAAVGLLMALSVGVAALALTAFVKLMPVRGDAVHSTESLARCVALDRALMQGVEAVENKTRTPKEAQSVWEGVLRAADEVARIEADDAQEDRVLAEFRAAREIAAPSINEAINRLNSADATLGASARQYAQSATTRLTAAARDVEDLLARQLDEQMGAARWWLAICIGLLLLTGLIMAATVLTWAYANYLDRKRAKAIGGGLVSEEAVDAAKRLSTAIDNGPLAVVEWDADFVCTRWSGRAEQIFGRTPAERVGKRWDEWVGHIHPEDQAHVVQQMQPLLDGRVDRVVIKHRNLHADGRVIHCVWHNCTVRDENGRPKAFLSLGDDVTRDVEVERAYHAEAEMLKRIAEIAPVGIAVRGRDEMLRFANDFILRLFGRTREDIADGKTYVAEWKIEELDGTPIPLNARPSEVAIRTGKPVYRREMRIISPVVPEPIIVSCSAMPLKNDNGEIDSALVIYEDISTRVDAEEEREAMSEELSRARRLETVGNLAGGIAHDFGNVLLAISFSADALATAASAGASVSEPSTQLRHAIGVARELTDSLVNYAAGRDGTRRPMDLAAFLHRHCKFVARLLPSHFKVQCATPSDGKPVMVNASGPQLLQVLMNLAVNARDAMPMGGLVNLSLSIENGNTALLEVSDNGHGMTPEVSRRAFERFYTTKQVGEGTGLGLPTVRNVVNEHGGTIELSTAVGQGTKFLIRLPITQAAPAPVEVQPVRAPAPPQVQPQPAATDLPRSVPPQPASTGPEAAALAAQRAAAAGAGQTVSRAMVIESDDRVRPLIVQTLRNSGFHVESFMDAQSGLDAFQRAPQAWSIVLAELGDGRLDTATCVRRMRETATSLPVLLLTDDPSETGGTPIDTQTRVLVKPFTVGSLRSALADLLNAPSLR